MTQPTIPPTSPQQPQQQQQQPFDAPTPGTPAPLTPPPQARPEGRWKYAMRWHDLLFLHWAVPIEKLRPHVPAGLEIDTFDGQAYVGLVPFHITRLRRRWLPPIPLIAAFPEINVRTYVHRGGHHGIYFLSLDAMNEMGVKLGRALFKVPYNWAEIDESELNGTVQYHSTRRGATQLQFMARYRPISSTYYANANTLEYWLTERYCMFTEKAGALWRTDIHHPRWPLQMAQAQIQLNTLTNPFQIELAGRPLLHFVRRIDALIWKPKKV